MAIVKNPLALLKHAKDNGYAIGAFNVNNMEITQAIMAAHAAKKAPVVLQLSSGARKYAGTTMLVDIIHSLVKQYPEVPVIVHQDHLSTYITLILDLAADKKSYYLFVFHDFTKLLRLVEPCIW